jgi:hypothetical protein
MRTLIAAFTAVVLTVLSPSSMVAQQGAGQGAAPQADRVASPNYDLAAQWTSEKVRKLVFDTSVTPRWLETSDRFWYSYQTREGRKFSLVDPIKRTKTPLGRWDRYSYVDVQRGRRAQSRRLSGDAAETVAVL